MDVRWKDGKDNILNANKEKIIYFDSETGTKTILSKDEVKKIIIEEGLMNIFKDFEHDLALTIVIPDKNKRDAVKIFNEFDKTGNMLKRKSNNFFMDLIFESSLILGNPFLGITALLFIAAIILNILTYLTLWLFGDIGLLALRIVFFGYPIYAIISYIHLRVKRKKMMEKREDATS